MEIQSIPISDIAPCPWQTRVIHEDQALHELAESIKYHGLLQPILVRRVEDEDRPYQIVAGERRWRAHSLAGLDTIQALVCEMSDHETQVACATENLQRKDLHPVEEAQSIQYLLDQDWSYEQVGNQVGRSTRWVARRASLTRLDESWRMMLCRPGQAVTKWSASHLELIARLAPEIQADLADRYKTSADDSVYKIRRIEGLSLANLREDLAEHLRVLDSAPWPHADETLSQADGPCLTCQRRSDREPLLLWDDVDFEDPDADGDEKPKRRKKHSAPRPHCLEPACWARKQQAFVTRQAEELRREHGDDLILVRDGYDTVKDYPEALYRWQTREVDQREPGARPMLIVSGDRAGHTGWAVVEESRRSSAGRGKAETLEDKRAALGVRRERHALEALADLLDDDEGSLWLTCSDEVKLALVATLGTHGRAQSWQYDALTDYGEQHTVCEAYRAVLKDQDGCLDRLCRSALKVAARIIRGNIQASKQSPVVTLRLGEAQWLCEVLGLDWEQLHAEAVEANPEPKSWTAKTKTKQEATTQ